METYRILAQGQTVSNDTWATGLNNNDLIREKINFPMS